jgi:hypothetical protein
VAVVPYVRATHSGGGTWTAAKANVIEAGVNDVSYAPTVRVYHNATQSITTATETALAFNTERWDQAGNAADTQHDTVTNNSRLTCRYAGVYLVTAYAAFVGNATGQRYLTVRINATASQFNGIMQQPGNATYGNELQVSSLVSLAVNDYVQAIVYQDSGIGLNVSAGSSLNGQNAEFMMVRVG